MSRQVLTITTAGIAHSGDVSHPGGFWMPMNRRNSLIGPYSGLKRRFHTTAIATIEVM